METMSEPKVIYQDEQVLVINKPAGMVVNRAETTRGKRTLQDWVGKNIKYQILRIKNKSQKSKIDQEFISRSGIVHRLDKDTSGVMVVAKTEEAFSDLQRQFRERQTQKTYLALVHGKLEPKEGAMCLPLGRSLVNRHKFTIKLTGKTAETSWQVERYLSKGDDVFSLVKLFPKTGRTHQLRVHLAHLGHPIVGDGQYLSEKRAKSDKLWCSRQFLHARELCFGLKGERKCFEADLARDLQQVLRELKTQN